MESTRKTRYIQKITFLQERLKDFDKYRYQKLSPLEIDGVYYRIQTVVDSMMDLIAMFLSDRGVDVADDYTNIDKMQENNIISRGLGEKLKKSNGLRNAIVHRYNGLIQEKILDKGVEIKEIAKELIEIFEKALFDE